MRFRIEIDLDRLSGDPHEEIGRILRYWGGNLKHYPVEPGAGETLRDAGYAEVGRWEFVEPAPDPAASAD